MKKAIKEGRGEEMKRLIETKLADIKESIEKDLAAIEELKNLNENEPRSVKMLNTLAAEEGSDRRFLFSGESTLIDGNDTIN